MAQQAAIQEAGGTAQHFLVHTLSSRRRVQLVRTEHPDDSEAVKRALLRPGEVVFYAHRIEAGDHLITVDGRLARLESVGGLTSILKMRFWDGELWQRPQIVGVDSIDKMLAPPLADAIHAISPGGNHAHTICGLRQDEATRILRQLRAATCPICRAAAERSREW